MFEFEVTSEFLLLFVASALALIFDYFPKVAQWYDGLDVATKRQIVAGLIALLGVVLFIGDCYGLFVTNLICDVKGFFELCSILLAAFGANQLTHFVLKPSAARKAKMFGKSAG